MVSQRYRSQQTIGGKLLRLEQKTDQAGQQGALADNSVDSAALATDSVTSDALAPNSVDSSALGNGAVGTENLGIVDQINSGTKLTLNSPGGVALAGAGYTNPAAGNYVPLAMDSSGNIITNTGVAFQGTIDPYWTSGKPNVTLSDGTIVSAFLGDQTSYNPGDSVVLSAYGGVFTVVAHAYVRPQYMKMIDLTPYFLNGWTTYYSGGPGLNEFGAPSVSMDSNGNVILSGLIRRLAGNPTAGSAMFTLPQPFWPQERKIFISYSATGIGQIEIDATGNVTYTTGGAAFMSLENIRYSAAPLASFTSSTLQNSWVNYGTGGYATAGYLKDANGLVWTKGLIKSGTATTPTALQTFTAGNEPLLTQHFATVSANAFGYYRIGGSAGSGQGRVQNFGVGSNAWFSIEGMFPDMNSPLQWTTPLLTNSWTNYNAASYSSAGYTKTADGLIILRGLVNGGTSTIFTLPPGYRPATSKLFANATNATLGRLDVLQNGQVNINVGSNTWFSLDQISFVAQQ